MKKFANTLRLALCLTAVAIALGVPTSVLAADPGPPGGLNVKVVNTPLSVQGTVNVGNFPATQPVSGSVSITGTPNVNVTNPATAPLLAVNVNDPGRIPYQSVDTKACGPPSVECIVFFTAVPSGHRLVIQHVSMNFASGTGIPSSVVAFLGVDNFSPFSGFVVPVVSFGTGSSEQVDQPVLAYVDAGHKPAVEMNSNLPIGEVFVAVSGYLVDCNLGPCAAIVE